MYFINLWHVSSYTNKCPGQGTFTVRFVSKPSYALYTRRRCCKFITHNTSTVSLNLSYKNIFKHVISGFSIHSSALVVCGTICYLYCVRIRRAFLLRFFLCQRSLDFISYTVFAYSPYERYVYIYFSPTFPLLQKIGNAFSFSIFAFYLASSSAWAATAASKADALKSYDGWENSLFRNSKLQDLMKTGCNLLWLFFTLTKFTC